MMLLPIVRISVDKKSCPISHLKTFRIIFNELPGDPVLMILILSEDV